MKNVTFINAGAGSGKTYTLTNILAKKLAETDASGRSVIRPSQVILTTFTELAAAEFREKARAQILAKRNYVAASQMDSAAIGTVHSVALQFIKKFWYLLDYGADIQTISDRDEDFYMSQSLARIVSERDADGHIKKQEDLDNFRRFRDHFDICDGFSHPDYLFWQRHLNAVVEKMEYYDVDDVEVSIEKSIATLRSVYNAPRETPEMLHELLAYLQKYYKYIENKTTGNAVSQAKLIKPLLQHCESVMDLLSLRSLKPVGGQTTVENSCPGFGQFMDTLNQFTTSASQLDIFEPFVRSIFHIAKEWRDDYKQYKKRNHLVSYNDMEQLFLHLLTSEQEVMDYVRDNFRLVMVDEFQDSNPIQLKIFNRLSELIAPSDGHSYWVGDPKQAIYGFRGADTDLVNKVSQNFTFYPDAEIHPEEGPNHLGSGRLVESWRSRSQLVRLVNAIFYEPFKDQDGINELCITLKPHFTSDSLLSSPLKHWECAEKNKEKAAAAMAEKVRQVLDSGMLVHSDKLDGPTEPIKPRHIAILARKNDDVKDIVRALRKQGIPVSEPEDAILQRIEVQLVITLLHYMQNPSDKHVIADILRMLEGQTTADILRDRIDYLATLASEKEQNPELQDEWKADDAAIQELLRKTVRFRHLSIPEIVRGLIYECNIPAIAARWGDQPVRQQNLSTLQHLADSYDAMCLQMGLGTSISGFIYYLYSAEPDKEKDNHSDTVKVFTYHGAKGLEWPMVIMHGLDKDALEVNDFIKKQFLGAREQVLVDKSSESDPFAKDYYIHFYPNFLKGSSSNVPETVRDKIVELPLYNQLNQKAVSEERRLLYVGMTRAKDYLYTLGYNDKYSWLERVGVQHPQKENIWGLTEFQPINESAVMPEEETIQTADQEYTLIKKPEVHDDFSKRYLKPSKLETFEGYNSHFAWQEKGLEIDQKNMGNDYATLGTCIHNIFAAYRPDDHFASRVAAVSIVAGFGLTNNLSGHIDAILRSADWLYTQLQQHFPQTPSDTVCREYPFQYTLPGGQTLRGEMDLLWYYTDATGQHCVLVDYKTFLGVALHDHTTTHYAQLSAYASALRRAGIDVTHALIYYPAHATIHELKIKDVVSSF